MSLDAPNTQVAALYRFVRLEDYENLRGPLLAFCEARGIRGTLLLAEEGINGTIAGTEQAITEVLAYLKGDDRLADLECKFSYNTDRPFLRMKVKLKKEIVTMGRPGIDPNQCVGRYASPEQWNALVDDPECLVIDTRNDYEVEIGTFQGAINPNTTSFREFPEWVEENLDPRKHKKVAMFCTGGIRCEKSTSLLVSMGFEDVWHLQGGILNYLEKTPVEQTRWDGECFVFDSRVSVDHHLEKGATISVMPVDSLSMMHKRHQTCTYRVSPAHDATRHTVTSRNNDSLNDKSRFHWLKRVERPT